jgi:hypothetical protein
MAKFFFLTARVCFFAGLLNAQNAMRHAVTLDTGGMIPLSGWKTIAYSAGPALRTGYEIRLATFFAAEAGWTRAWMRGTTCNRFGCEHPRRQLRLVDFGLRGVAPLASGRIELSIGMGGGHAWLSDSYLNELLLQYSARATVAVDSPNRFRVGATIRTWRDLGRPTQQWLSVTAGVTYGFGGRL